MDKEIFCTPCYSKSNGKRVCSVEEFYPSKGYCPVAIVLGESVILDCNNIHFKMFSVPRKSLESLAQLFSQKHFIPLRGGFIPSSPMTKGGVRIGPPQVLYK